MRNVKPSVAEEDMALPLCDKIQSEGEGRLTVPLWMLTSFAVPSADPVIASVDSLLMARQVITSLWKRASSEVIRCTADAVLGSQTIKEASSETVTILLPSGVNMPLVTGPEWPLKTFMNAPEGTAHIHTDESVAPAKMMFPLGCQLIHYER